MREGNSQRDMSDRRDANRKRMERERMREDGFVWFQTWVHQDDMSRVKRLTKKLRSARQESEDE